MNSFVCRLRLTQEEVKRQLQQQSELAENYAAVSSSRGELSNSLVSDEETANASAIVTSATSEARLSRRKERRCHEGEQKIRMRQREKEEEDRERTMILEGKMDMSMAQTTVVREDPDLRAHSKLLKVERKASAMEEKKLRKNSVSPRRGGARSPNYDKTRRKSPNSSQASSINRGEGLRPPSKSPRPKCKTSSIRRHKKSQSVHSHKSSMKLRWKKVAGKVRLQNVFSASNGHHHMEDAPPAADVHTMVEEVTDTVVASLVYDEGKDELIAAATAKSEEREKRASGGNPVFDAFEGARDVDDLYRIAEIWVNPLSYIT